MTGAPLRSSTVTVSGTTVMRLRNTGVCCGAGTGACADATAPVISVTATPRHAVFQLTLCSRAFVPDYSRRSRSFPIVLDRFRHGSFSVSMNDPTRSEA